MSALNIEKHRFSTTIEICQYIYELIQRNNLILRDKTMDNKLILYAPNHNKQNYHHYKLKIFGRNVFTLLDYCNQSRFNKGIQAFLTTNKR